MQTLFDYFQQYGMAVAFNVTLLVICFLIARVVNVRPIQALVFGFLPLLLAMALLGGTGRELVEAAIQG